MVSSLLRNAAALRQPIVNAAFRPSAHPEHLLPQKVQYKIHQTLRDKGMEHYSPFFCQRFSYNTPNPPQQNKSTSTYPTPFKLKIAK